MAYEKVRNTTHQHLISISENVLIKIVFNLMHSMIKRNYCKTLLLILKQSCEFGM